MNEIEFSIIIPLYNQEKYIERCLKSAIEQGFKGNYEIIIVNDGSTDKSGEILKKFNDKKLKIFENKNSGPAYSRNFGIKKAEGKYIVFLDSDDTLDKNALQTFYNTNNGKNLNADIVFAPYYVIREHKNDMKIYFPLKKFANFDGFLNIENTDGEVLKGNFEPWAKAYKKDFLIQNGIIFEEARLAEDLPFFYNAVLNTEKILTANTPVYFYRRGHKNFLKEGKYDWGDEVIKIFQKSDEIFQNQKFWHDKKNYSTIEKIYAKNCLNICLFWARRFKKLKKRWAFYKFCGGFLSRYGLSTEFYIKLFIRNLVDILQNKC